MITGTNTDPLPTKYDNSFCLCQDAGFCVHRGANIRLELLRANVMFACKTYIGAKELRELAIILEFRGKLGRDDESAHVVLYYVPARTGWSPFSMTLVPMIPVQGAIHEGQQELRLRVEWDFHLRDTVVPLCSLWDAMVRMLNMPDTPVWELRKM